LRVGAAAALLTAIGLVAWTTVHEAMSEREQRHALREDARDR
jgi:hypothetical protein